MAGMRPAVVDLLALIEGLAREVGDDVVLEACRRFMADPARGFAAALRAALDEARP